MSKIPDAFMIEACAHAAHETLRAFNKANGDLTYKAWDQETEEQRTVATDGVSRLFAQDQTVEQSHQSWVIHMQNHGWKLGSTKDTQRKIHPCLVEWSALSFEQQGKDILFVSTAKSVMAALLKFPTQ